MRSRWGKRLGIGILSLGAAVATVELVAAVRVRIVPLFLPDTPPEIAREGLLHTWQSFNGTLRHVGLTRPIAVPLERIGPKVTFVHGRADHITSLSRVRALAAKTGAQVVETRDDHLSYPSESARRILSEMEAR